MDMVFDVEGTAEYLAELVLDRMKGWTKREAMDTGDVRYSAAEALTELSHQLVPDFTVEQCITILQEYPKFWDSELDADFSSVRESVRQVVRTNAIELAMEHLQPDILAHVGEHYPQKLTSQERAILALMKNEAPTPSKGLSP